MPKEGKNTTAPPKPSDREGGHPHDRPDEWLIITPGFDSLKGLAACLFCFFVFEFPANLLDDIQQIPSQNETDAAFAVSDDQAVFIIRFAAIAAPAGEPAVVFIIAATFRQRMKVVEGARPAIVLVEACRS